jgi:3-oxoacyl-[acyl-carrier protein] reductase
MKDGVLYYPGLSSKTAIFESCGVEVIFPALIDRDFNTSMLQLSITSASFGIKPAFHCYSLSLAANARKAMNRLIAVVTGGTKGIGLGIAEALLKHNASLAVTYHQDDTAAENAKKRLQVQAHNDQKILLLKGDVGDFTATETHHRTIVARLGEITVLVNNAAMVMPRSLEDVTIEEWNQTVRVNLSGAFYWSSLVVPGMKKTGFGRIINISSIAARGGGVVGPHYAASKSGMLGLTRYAARELGPFGITVNAIAPAFIEDASIFASWTAEQKAELKKKVFVPRLGLVADVVNAFEYLLETPYVTGVTLDVNGGAFVI